MRPKPGFDDNERAVLLGIYEEADGVYNAYSLALRISRAKVGTPEAVSAVAQTKAAIERLIEKGIVRGTRQKDAQGVFFTNLKLTAKGEQTAIRERDHAAAAKKAMDETTDHANRITAMLNNSRDDQDK